MHSNEDITAAYERTGCRVADDLDRLRMLLVDAEHALSAALADLCPSRRSVSDDLQRDLKAIRSIRADLDGSETSATNAQVAYPGQGPTPDALTHPEREVAILLALGLTNRQIADKLVISPGTVRVHVEHIFVKLEVHTRAQLAAWMADQQIGRRPVAGNEPDKV